MNAEYDGLKLNLAERTFFSLEEPLNLEDDLLAIEERTAADLRPYAALWKNADFQRWRQELELELVQVKELEWAIDFKLSPRAAAILKSMGLARAPRNEREILLYFAVVRGVVHYLRMQAVKLEAAATRFEEAQKIINEETSGDVRTRR